MLFKPNSWYLPGLARQARRRVPFIAFLLVATLCLLLTQPVAGRWEIPETLAAVEGAASPLSTPTTVPLPEQAPVPILMYHYVSELPPDPDAYRRDLTVSPEAFQAHLQYLADEGYHPVALTDLYLYLTQGLPLLEKPIILTFDDGYRDAYEVVFPLLLDYGFTGTFFVLATPAHYEWSEYLTWAEMKEMSDAGMDIQAHGRDHVDLRDRPNDFLVYQILGIQEAIDYHTGRLPRFFCYPSGRRDQAVIDVLESAGYWGAVTTEWGSIQTLENRFEMPRIRIRGGDTLDAFVAILEG